MKIRKTDKEDPPLLFTGSHAKVVVAVLPVHPCARGSVGRTALSSLDTAISYSCRCCSARVLCRVAFRLWACRHVCSQWSTLWAFRLLLSFHCTEMSW